jgi:Protein of unknown function (DUF1194)
MRHWITSFRLLNDSFNLEAGRRFWKTDLCSIRVSLVCRLRHFVGSWSARVRAAAPVLTLAAAIGSPAAAQTAPPAVDLQLVLAVDVSGSVNQMRFELQRDGYVAAFRHPHVLAAIRSGPAGAIAVTVTQWTGPALQFQVVPWTRISDAASAEDFAAAIERAPRQLFGGGTSISGAIDHAMSLWRESPFQAPRRVIDVSGDGANNRGRPAAQARDEAVAAGIGINGLPILALEPDLDRYYEQNVIGGPGAFMVVAHSYEAFAEAVRRKLIIEIADRQSVERSLALRQD